MDNPKVFICHAGEDNVFAKALGEALLKNGVDAWVDDWEILPGGKLFQKVFPAIRECDVFIIVLSKDSVEKPWIKEELDAALVMRIENQTKLIPIRIDDCEVPLTLRATAWETIDPGKDIEGQIEPILTSIFNKTIKPELGEIPERFQDAEKVDDLDIVETGVLKSILSIYEDKGKDFIWGKEIEDQIGYAPEEINDAVDILESESLVTVARHAGTTPFKFGHVKLTPDAYMEYAGRFFQRNTEDDSTKVLAYIVSEDRIITGEEIQKGTGIEASPLNMYVEYWGQHDYISVTKYSGTAPFSFGDVEPTALGRRALRNL